MLIEAIPTVGKNTQQVRAAIQKQVKAYEKLLNAFCGSARVEASLIVHVQVRAAELIPPLTWPQLQAPVSLDTRERPEKPWDKPGMVLAPGVPDFVKLGLHRVALGSESVAGVILC